MKTLRLPPKDERHERRESVPLEDRREMHEPEARPVLISQQASQVRVPIPRRQSASYRVLKPYGPFVRGQVIQPTGIYRDQLLARGVIERVKDE